VKRMTLCLLAGLILASSAAIAQDQYMELLRQDLRTEKVAIVTAAMMLTDAQGEAFWPVYREYDNELAKIWDERIALIKRYAENYDSMTDETADEIASAAMKLSDKRLKLRTDYYKKMKKEVGAIVAARFWQVDGLIQNLVDVQVSAELPLVMKTEGAAAGH
jgi:hypothetical protein